MRDLRKIDDELRLLSVIRRAFLEFDRGKPSSAEAVDRLSDERLKTTRHRARCARHQTDWCLAELDADFVVQQIKRT